MRFGSPGLDVGSVSADVYREPYGRVPPRGAEPAVVYVPVPTKTARCSRLTYVLLGLFLGTLGIHNFVAGRIGRAVAQLLLTVVCAFAQNGSNAIVLVWVVIELFTVKRDGKGVRMS